MASAAAAEAIEDGMNLPPWAAEKLPRGGLPELDRSRPGVVGCGASLALWVRDVKDMHRFGEGAASSSGEKSNAPSISLGGVDRPKATFCLGAEAGDVSMGSVGRGIRIDYDTVTGRAAVALVGVIPSFRPRPLTPILPGEFCEVRIACPGLHAHSVRFLLSK